MAMSKHLINRIVACFPAVAVVLGIARNSPAWGQSCTTWVHRTDVGTPGKRVSPAMAYDSDRGVTVFFGGEYSDAGSSTISYYNDTWEYDGTSWKRITLAGVVPDPRSGHAMVYDNVRHEIVMFGGVGETRVGGFLADTYFKDTWTYQGAGSGLGLWTRRADLIADPTVAPRFSARAGHAMAFDAAHGVVVMSGGTGGDNSTSDGIVNGYPPTMRGSDIWLWNGAKWSQAGYVYLPEIHYDGGAIGPWQGTFTRHAMAFDPVVGAVLQASGTGYFSGVGGAWFDSEFNDLFSFSINGNQATARPAGILSLGRQQFAMVYDAQRNCFVVFGGVTSDAYAPSGNSHEELTYDPSSSSYASIIRVQPVPPARARHAMVYDNKRQRTVLFGGASGDARYDDTWELVNVGPTFTQQPTNQTVSPCSSVSFHVAVAGDPPQAFHWRKDGQPLADGGRLSGVSTDTLLITETAFADEGYYSASVTTPCGTNSSLGARLVLSNAWTLIATNGPRPRYQHGMAYDEARGVTVLFGGQLRGNIPNGETWEWNGNTWFLMTTNGPSPRYGISMAYDSTRAKTLLFGGNVNNTGSATDYRRETWEWDGTAWTLRGTNGPAARAFAPMIYDRAARRFVLFGGYLVTNSSPSRVFDTWEYDSQVGAWIQVADGAPKPLAGEEALAYDIARNKRVLLTDGLITYGESAFLLVWEWDGANWVRQSPQLDPHLPSYLGGPTKVSGEAIAYHPRRHQVIINNGNDGNFVVATWAYDGVGWQLLSANDGPHAEQDGKMVYDTARDALVQFGGADNIGFVSSQTWELVDADAIKLLKQPASVAVGANQPVQLSVTARGKPLLQYRWRKDGVELTDGGRISGAKSGLLTILNANPAADAGSYDVVVANDCGSVTSDRASLQFVAAGLVLNVGFSASHWQLNWQTNNAVLETATKVTGPWSAVSGAASPFPILTNEPARFFRLRQP